MPKSLSRAPCLIGSESFSLLVVFKVDAKTPHLTKLHASMTPRRSVNYKWHLRGTLDVFCDFFFSPLLCTQTYHRHSLCVSVLRQEVTSSVIRVQCPAINHRRLHPGDDGTIRDVSWTLLCVNLPSGGHIRCSRSRWETQWSILAITVRVSAHQMKDCNKLAQWPALVLTLSGGNSLAHSHWFWCNPANRLVRRGQVTLPFQK